MENDHIVKKFDKNLDKIKEKILEMGDLVGAQVRDATAMWISYDADEVARIIALDLRVNGLHREVYKRAEVLIARRQPVALDLRETLAPINIAGELERIGDHAKSSAKRAFIFSENRPDRKLFDNIAKMSAIVQVMLSDVLIAYDHSNTGQAAEVREQDREIDDLHQEMLKSAITSLSELSGNKELTAGLVHLVLISRNLERVGDHIVNISRYINQIVEGDDLKATEQSGNSRN